MAAEIALPQGYALHEYRVEETLGIGGFGLTYLATDSNLNLKVAIKEYLPGDLAQRGEDQSVQPKSESSSESFKWGLSRFLDESRTLASFRHPNIVRVLRFFEANSTAYMVMEFVAGQPLGEWIRIRRPLEQSAVLAIATPLLDGLEVIHRTGYLHRDIKPGNVFIREDGSPVLLDFGSARSASSGTERTAIVTPGYAPIEQYHSQGRQGPWSDLYAFGGVLYWMIIGKRPVEAVARVRQDMLPPAVQVADRSRYSIELLAAVDWALVSHEEQRPQSVAELRSALAGIAQPDPKSVIHQTTVKIQVCQGESRRFEENTALGELTLTDIAPRQRGQVAIAVTFEINTDGILSFFATKITPILLAVLGIIFIGRASRGEISRVLTSSAIAIIGLAFIAGAATLLFFGGSIINLLFK